MSDRFTPAERAILKQTILKLKPAIKSFWLAEAGSPTEERAVDVIVASIEGLLAQEGEGQ